MAKKIFRVIKATGAWIVPIWIIISVLAFGRLHSDKNMSVSELLLIISVSCAIVMYATGINWTRLKNGKDIKDIKVFDTILSPEQYDYDDCRTKAMYPTVPEKMTSEIPNGFIFGSPVDDKDKYVLKNIYEPGHIGIFGGTGAGKTQQLIPSILALKGCLSELEEFKNYTYKKSHLLAIDTKGELAEKTYRAGDIIFDPKDRDFGWGYNPLHRLNKDGSSTEQQAYKEFVTIAKAIIPDGTGSEDFWRKQAQDLFVGLSIHNYKNGSTDLPSICRAILSDSIDNVIENAISKSEVNSKAYKILIRYNGLASDTLTSINATLVQYVQLYAIDDDIEYSLSNNNPHRFNPTMLLSNDVYLCVSPEELARWSGLILLIVSQAISYGLSIEEYDNDKDRCAVYIIFEEFTAVMNSLHASLPAVIVTGLQMLRSKKFYLVLVMQSMSGLQAIVDGNIHISDDAISNLSYIYILDATTPDTQKMIVDFAGTFERKRISWNRSNNNRSHEISYETTNILKEADLIQLGGSDEAILISRTGGYSRLKKTPAWKDKYFSRLMNKPICKS